MKNMMFIFRGLVKTSFVIALMFGAQSMSAQSLGTQLDALTTPTSKGSISVSNANYLSSTEAADNLEATAAQLNSTVITDDVEQNNAQVTVEYYKYLATLINNGTSVSDSMVESVSFLNSLLGKKSNLVDLTTTDLFNSALGLVTD